MAKLNYKNGVTGVILRVKIMDTTSTTGAGKTGLTSASSGLLISTIADNEATPTAYSGSNLETIATLGTFAAPTAGKARFKEVDATNHSGLYEIQIADARWAVSNARSVIVSVSGVTGAAQVDAEVQLEAVPAEVLSALAVVCNKIADHVRRRTQANVEASSDGDALSLLSLYGLIQQHQESNTAANPGDLTVFKTDGTTELGRRAIDDDPSANPVVGLS